MKTGRLMWKIFADLKVMTLQYVSYSTDVFTDLTNKKALHYSSGTNNETACNKDAHQSMWLCGGTTTQP